MDYLGVRLGENYGSASALAVSLGMQARLTEALWIGAHVYNPNRVRIGGPYDDRIPTLLRAGFGYTFSTKLLMTLEAEKDIEKARKDLATWNEKNPGLRVVITPHQIQGRVRDLRTERLDGNQLEG